MRWVCDVQQLLWTVAHAAAWVMQEDLRDEAEVWRVAGAVALETVPESLSWKNKALGKVKAICYGWLSGGTLIGVMISWLSFNLLETWILRLLQVKGEYFFFFLISSSYCFPNCAVTESPQWLWRSLSGSPVCLTESGTAAGPDLPSWCWRELLYQSVLGLIQFGTIVGNFFTENPMGCFQWTF